MIRHRILVMLLALWGLAMIVPDLVRVVQPLGSFGFYANNDGLIYSVSGPFEDEQSSPAWRAGVRVGDRIDLERLDCRPPDIASCGPALTALGGLDFVLPGSTITLPIAATGTASERQVTLVAVQRPANFLVSAVNLACQIAGILVVIAAAWLVWTRPSAMSWGFFLYANWFNPGQEYAFYAILQQWPAALLMQDVASCFAEGAAYAGFLLFVLRVPNNTTEPRWRPLERALPLVALFFSALLLASYDAVLGYPSETITRAGIFFGFAADVGALGILLARRKTQRPEDYQRVRWVIWGCLIGLPTFLIAELASETTFFATSGEFRPSEDVIGLLYLVNGILCLFVFEAIRRERVVSVMIPLRRVTLLGLTLSIPALLLHAQVEHLQSTLELPGWAWLVLGAVAVFLITRLHEGAVHWADRYFNRELDAAEIRLGAAIRSAKAAIEIDRLLADGTSEALTLASAASFRRRNGAYVRDESGKGWEDVATRTLTPDEPLLAPLAKGKPFDIGDEDGGGLDLPQGLARPIFGVPAVSPARCFAVSFYGPHASGTDLDHNERAMLARLARDAAAMYAELESSELRRKVTALEGELGKTRSAPRKKRSVHGNL
ncbi:hypothetical protein [Methyloceanibacter sp.]|uniref:hypothetical protein n=1 Tax=Methyloceanibacter sp. TaxID=1965321 RepID=UPI002D54D8BA|nr:hypothetical protein [Methyloceanibacter sp.]HZP08856.1 hypothetical protein [Methyloceanibacter sp.]